MRCLETWTIAPIFVPETLAEFQAKYQDLRLDEYVLGKIRSELEQLRRYDTDERRTTAMREESKMYLLALLDEGRELMRLSRGEWRP